jgi:hypothetical protein
MQKAVVNAVMSCGLANDTDGMRELYIDNHYSSPSLFVLIQEKYNKLACDAICSNRKGWDLKVMNLSKNTPCGASLVKYDQMKKVLFGQWNDIKVVSFISTLGVFGMTTIQVLIRLISRYQSHYKVIHK